LAHLELEPSKLVLKFYGLDNNVDTGMDPLIFTLFPTKFPYKQDRKEFLSVPHLYDKLIVAGVFGYNGIL
jgi:hypothetical protein